MFLQHLKPTPISTSPYSPNRLSPFPITFSNFLFSQPQLS